MRAGDGIDISAVAIGPVGEAEQRPDIAELEPQRPRMADKRQAGEVRGAIVAVIARGSGRGRQQAFPFVETNGLGLGARLPCKFADLHREKTP